MWMRVKPTMEETVAQEILAHYQSYYRLSYSYLKNKEDAMDAVQESAYKAMVKCGHLKNPDAVSSWVYRIVVNTSLDLLRRRAKRPLVLSEQTADLSCAQPDEPPDKVDLSAALSLLDEKEHAIIVLRFYENKKISEITQILGENENTVKSRMYRAFKKMKLELEQEGALPPFEIGG